MIKQPDVLTEHIFGIAGRRFSRNSDDFAKILLFCNFPDPVSYQRLPTLLHALPGIAQKVLIQSLSDQGYEIRHCQIMPQELFSADRVIVSNSLMGEIPVLSSDGKPFLRCNIKSE